MNIFNYSVIVVLLLLFTLKSIDSQYLQCINPQNQRGFCVPYLSCSYLMNILKYYSQNTDAVTFIRRSVCGFNRQTQYVCCPQTTELRPQVNLQAQDRNFNMRQQGKTTQFQQQNQFQLGGNVQQAQNQQQQIQTSSTSSASLPRCGFDLDNRIFGGVKSSIHDFGWLALLRYSRSGSYQPIYKCAGSLINNRYILTAAHCVNQRALQNFRLSVRMGESNLLTDEDCESKNGKRICAPNIIDVPVEEIIIHEKYSMSSLSNDIALLRLSYKIQYNDYVKPICLQQDRSLRAIDLLGQSLVVAGFGQTEFASNSNQKLHVSLNVVENEKCDQVYRREGRRITDTQICAGGTKNEDSCKGDSGGPLMKLVNHNQELTWVLYGVVSFGSIPCGQTDIPGVYTKVDQYIDWIISKLKP